MKTHFLLISMILLSACSGCRTTSGQKEKAETVSPSAAKPEMLLQKIIGGAEGEERKDDQYFECKVMSDIEETDEVKTWIKALPRTVITGYHFRAQEPSIQLYAYEGNKQIVILKDHSNIEQAKAEADMEKNAVTQLKAILDKYCPIPSKTN